MNPLRKFRVLHVIRRLDIVGGAERLASEMARLEVSHDILIFDGLEPYFDLGTAKCFRAKSMLDAILLCIKMRNKYDRFHLHLFPAIYFGLILGPRAFIHEHSTSNRRREHLLFRALEWFIYRRVRGVIAISQATADSLIEWVGAGPKIYVVPNFVVTLPKPKKDLSLERKKPLISMVASFRHPKRQDLLIRALEYLPSSCHVMFAGSGPLLEPCQRLARNIGVESRVTFLGSVSDVAALYDHSDLCVLVSHWEGFGLVVLEASQFGTPSVVSDIEGLRDISPDDGLIFRGGSPLALAKKITECLELANDHTFQGFLKAYASKFDFPSYMEKIESVYEA